MPAVRTYTVTQEREVKVRAESPEDAVHESKAHFDAGVVPDPVILREALEDYALKHGIENIDALYKDGVNAALIKPEVTSVSARKDF